MKLTLTVLQARCLVCLVEHGDYPGGWKWENHSTTVRVLNRLAARGLADAITEQSSRTGDLYTRYRANEHGRAVAAVLPVDIWSTEDRTITVALEG